MLVLSSPSGAGKTTLTRYWLQAMGHTGAVKSPTFTLVEVYEVSRLYLYHFDFYRFMGSCSPREFEETGFREHFNRQSICIVEWPEKAAGLPPADLRIELKIELQAPTAADSGRIATIFADSEAGVSCLKRFTMT